jgi:hypothetical protein
VGIPSQPTTLSLDLAVLREKNLVTTNGQICTIDLPRALTLLTETDLFQRFGTYTVSLEHFVEEGLIPLVENRAPGKVIVSL